MSAILDAVVEVLATVLIFATIIGGLGLAAHWLTSRGPARRWLHDDPLENLPPVRRRESPTEQYLRRERERVTEWQRREVHR